MSLAIVLEINSPEINLENGTIKTTFVFVRNKSARIPHTTKMANISTCPPLTRSSVQDAHRRIKQYVHRTPTVTCTTLDTIASTPQSARDADIAREISDKTPFTGDAKLVVKLFFKCENMQKIGAFKARGAFHALVRLIDEEGIETIRQKGVVTHSSGSSDLSGTSYMVLTRTTFHRKPCAGSCIGGGDLWGHCVYCHAEYLDSVEDLWNAVTRC